MQAFIHFLHHLFAPHHSNNFKARSLHLSAIAFYIVVLAFIQLLSTGIQKISPNILGYATDISVEKILTLVNERRVSQNLVPLNLSLELNNAANQKALDMFSKNYWAHISPAGATPWVFITKAGYDYLYAGENLAKDFDKSQEVVDAWMNSSSHRANLLKPEYTDIGLAVVNGTLNGQETTLVVQEFGSKLAKIDRNDLSKSKPVALPTAVEVTDTGIAAGTNDTSNTISGIFSRRVTKTVSFILAEFLLVILFIDSIYIWKYKTYRISGHSIAHLLFIAALIGAMGATGVGVIL